MRWRSALNAVFLLIAVYVIFVLCWLAASYHIHYINSKVIAYGFESAFDFSDARYTWLVMDYRNMDQSDRDNLVVSFSNGDAVALSDIASYMSKLETSNPDLVYVSPNDPTIEDRYIPGRYDKSIVLKGGSLQVYYRKGECVCVSVSCRDIASREKIALTRRLDSRQFPLPLDYRDVVELFGPPDRMEKVHRY